MNQKVLVEIKKQFEQQRDAEIRACRAKWRRKMDALDLLLKTHEGLGAPDQKEISSSVLSVPATVSATIEETRKEGAMEAVRRAIEDIRAVFTSRTLVDYINNSQRLSLSERDIANPLWRLRKSGDIRVLERGRGRKPSIYIKA